MKNISKIGTLMVLSLLVRGGYSSAGLGVHQQQNPRPEVGLCVPR